MFNTFLSANGYNGGLGRFAGMGAPLVAMLGLLIGVFGFVFVSYALIGWAIAFFVTGVVVLALGVVLIVLSLRW
jgi:hypothetical protein